MESPQDENEVNSLENTATESTGGGPADNDQKPEENDSRSQPKQKVNARLQSFIARINIYLLLFILIMVLALGIVFISMQRSKKEVAKNEFEAQQLTPEELEKIRGSDVKVGDPKQTLSVESNAIFAGKVLIRDSLDVAGTIKVGGALSLPGITVSGTSAFDQITANQLSIAGDTSIQGQLNVQKNLAVSGSASFGGAVSAPQLTISALSINNDLSFNRHLDAGGGSPGRTNGSALGNGGTTSISGTDTAGTLRVNIGSGPAAGCFATVNFSNTFNGTPHIAITPIGSSAAALNWYVSNRTTSGFSICTTNPAPSGSSFSFDFIVID